MIDAGTFLERVAENGRNAGPHMLQDAYRAGQLDPATLALVLPAVWSGAEYPEFHLHVRDWVALFRLAGFSSTPPGHEPPTEPLTIYRGAIPHRARGMAWTTDREQASWFANRYELGTRREWRDAYVYVATVEPPAVLAACDDRTEGELVIDPAMLPRPVTRALPTATG